MLAQILAHHAANLARMRYHAIQRAVLRQPLDGSLGADLGDARDVIHGITHQREVIDNTFGRHAELGAHTRHVEHLIAHGVDQGDMPVHQLGEILVAGGNYAILSARGRLRGERADHVVGLDAFDAQKRPAKRMDAGMQRFYLGDEVVRHRRPVRLIVGKPFIAEGLSLGIKNDGAFFGGGVICGESPQHAEHPVNRAGRRIDAISQVGQGMKGAVQIRRPVNK